MREGARLGFVKDGDGEQGGPTCGTTVSRQRENTGLEVTLNIDPDPGYHTASVTDNETIVTPTPTDSYAIDSVTEDHDIIVTFEENVSNPVPTTTSISPESKIAGDPGFTLTVNGTNFVEGCNVRWNGSDRTTMYVSPIKLTASISEAEIASAGTAPPGTSPKAPLTGGSRPGCSFRTRMGPRPPVRSPT